MSTKLAKSNLNALNNLFHSVSACRIRIILLVSMAMGGWFVIYSGMGDVSCRIIYTCRTSCRNWFISDVCGFMYMIYWWDSFTFFYIVSIEDLTKFSIWFGVFYSTRYMVFNQINTYYLFMLIKYAFACTSSFF